MDRLFHAAAGRDWTMDHRERFHLTISRQPVDRPACWLGLPTPEMREKLLDHYRAQDFTLVKRQLGDDLYPIFRPKEIGLRSFGYPEQDISLTGEGLLPHPDLESIKKYRWPEPKDYISADDCRSAVMSSPTDYALLAVLWSSHYHIALKLLGMETAFMSMIEAPEVLQEVLGRANAIFMKVNDGFFQATKGRLDAVLFGNDLGAQRGLMISLGHIRKFVLPGIREQIQHAHSYHLKVIYHSCGAISDLIPDLIEAGVDAIHPMQTTALGMNEKTLKDRFGTRVSFCGGIDAQELLPAGTPSQVRRKVEEMIELFPTGLIVSPSHEAILPDVPIANIEALFDRARQ
jgi:uroporphyrinogen decarboxylase